MQELSDALSQLRSSDGKNLPEFQDQLRTAATSALEAGGGREDVMAAVQAVLDENGFDSDEVMSTLRGIQGLAQSAISNRFKGLLLDSEV